MPLIQLFFDICLMRRGPQDVPASAWLLRLALGSYAAIGFMLLTLGGGSPGDGLAEVLLDLALLTAIVLGALRWRGLQVRFIQTLTALLGAGVVMSVIALPVVHWLYVSHTAGAVDPLAVLFWRMLQLWSLAVMGHVMRHALQGSFALGMLFSVGYFVLQYLLFSLLFPGPSS